MHAIVWLKGLRLPLYWASGAPILLSLALALGSSSLTRPVLWAAGAAALLIFEVGVNIVAEIADRSEGVFVTQREGWLPTGPYLIEETGISNEKMERYAALSFAVSGLIGLYLAFVTGFVVILLTGVAGLALTLIYAAPPLMLGLRGLGEPVPFLAFGPLPGFALYFLATGAISAEAVLLMLPTAFWITAVRFAHHLPDRSMRRGARFEGTHRLRVKYSLQLLTAFVLLAIASIAVMLPVSGPYTLLPVAAAAPFTWAALRSSRRAAGNAVSVSRGTKYYVALQIAGSVAMAVALIL